jgi:guanylate kinase
MRTWDRHIGAGGLLVVLSGPSGVGKDSVLEEFEKIYPNAVRCVTATTRPRRDYEQDGVDYTFLSVEEFRARIEAGGFLEYAEVYGHLYGTPRQWVEDNLGRGLDIILKIDVQGGRTVKRAMASAVMVFLVPPSLEELERRLRSRSSEPDEVIAKRLGEASEEIDRIPCYDYVIENGDLMKAAEELKAVLIAEHCRVRQE